MQHNYQAEKTKFAEKESALRHELSLAQQRLTTLELELTHVRERERINASEREKERESERERLARAQSLYEAECALRVTLEERGMKDKQRILALEENERAVSRLERELSESEERERQTREAMERLLQRDVEKDRQCGDAERIAELLRRDKAFLESEKDRLSMLLTESERARERERERATQAETQAAQAQAMLAETQSRLHRENEERRERDIDKIQ